MKSSPHRPFYRCIIQVVFIIVAFVTLRSLSALVAMERHIDLATEGIDIAIRARTLEYSTLIARSLFDNPQILVASPEYIAQSGEPKVPSDLKQQHSCIVYTLKKTLNNWLFKHEDTEVSIPVSGPFRSNNSETNLEIALTGLGITQMPIWMVDEHLKTGRLVQVLKKV